VIVCGVLETEVRHYAAGLDHVVRICVLEQGLHNEPERLRREVQAHIEAIELIHAPEAIALVYGVCSRGTEGLHCRAARLVLPRAHDCITIFLGSKERYARELREHPGTYWYSPGWNATGTQPGPDRERWNRERFTPLCEDEEDLEEMLEVESEWMANYKRVAYTDLQAGDCALACAYAEGCAKHCGWSFDAVPGDPGLLRDLLAGHWDAERFLVCEAGETPKLSNDAAVVRAEPWKDGH
jgi:hypothetical protein